VEPNWYDIMLYQSLTSIFSFKLQILVGLGRLFFIHTITFFLANSHSSLTTSI